MKKYEMVPKITQSARPLRIEIMSEAKTFLHMGFSRSRMKNKLSMLSWFFSIIVFRLLSYRRIMIKFRQGKCDMDKKKLHIAG